MKARLLKVEPIENFTVNADVLITEDDGTMVYSGHMAFFTTDGTIEGAQKEIESGLRNKYLQIHNERNAKLKEVAESMLNKEISL